MGFILNKKNKPSDTPQESHEGAWLVTLNFVSDEARKGYTFEYGFWTRDSSLKVSIIEW